MQNTNENRNIGENIRLYRIKSGMTIEELRKKIYQHHNLEIKVASLRNYEKGVERIPAVALGYIAEITKTDVGMFYEEAHNGILLDNTNKAHLLEAYSLIQCPSVRDSLLHLARKLANRKSGGSNA